MNRFTILAATFLLLGALLCPGQESVVMKPQANLAPPSRPQVIPVPSRSPQAWLGLQLSKPSPSTTAHIRGLPPGVGFIVTSADPGGPGEAAGVQGMDLIWKMGDQMLVNEAQLVTLLRLQKPGDEVKLFGFRAGEPLEIILKLGEAPPNSRSFNRDLAESAILPLESAPMRVVNVAAKLASYSTEDGRAVVLKEGDFYKITITSPSDQLIYDGSLPAESDFAQIPEAWRVRVSALRRGLDHALEGGGYNIAPPRQPRPRVIPPPVSAAPKS